MPTVSNALDHGLHISEYTTLHGQHSSGLLVVSQYFPRSALTRQLTLLFMWTIALRKGEQKDALLVSTQQITLSICFAFKIRVLLFEDLLTQLL